MQPQYTLNAPVTLEGMCAYGGSQVTARIHPTSANTGIVFRTPENGFVNASLKNARYSRSAIALRSDGTEVIIIEHVCATLYAMNVDNAIVSVERTRGTPFALTKIQVLPVSSGREQTLCDKIGKVGLRELDVERNYVTVDRPYRTERLFFEPNDSPDLVLEMHTEYKIPGPEKFTLVVGPNNYREQVSRARCFAKHVKYVPHWLPDSIVYFIACVANPQFGLGFGYDRSTVFVPTKDLEAWRQQEYYPEEIARHAAVDRLGELSLIGRRFVGVKVTSRGSGHKNTLKVLRAMDKEGVIVPAKRLLIRQAAE
tara:strand:- start:3543 stop:4478 length:936 start_codon:yes stop_codon:yes gene_type:complete